MRESTDESMPIFPEGARIAFENLVEGNQRFTSGNTRHAHQSSAWRTHLVAQQAPIAALIGCSDSRVSPELVFDQGLGDLFVIRVAGNIISPDVLGSVAYALEHLKTQLVVVLGHENCGAVTAAIEAMNNPQTHELAAIRDLLALIEPGLKHVDTSLPKDRRIAAGVEANVRWSVNQLAGHPIGQKLLADRRCFLVGGVYELATGTVRFLND